MTKRTYTRHAVSFAFLTAMLILLLFWDINSGSIHPLAGEIGKILTDQTGNSTAYYTVWDIRLPRILAVVILGGALSVSGSLLQAFFANPIAGPFILGISSGAKLVVSLLMIFMLRKGMSVNSAAMILAAFAGAMISMGFVLPISDKVKKMSMLVICGVMIGYICSTMADFAVAFADDANTVSLHNWSMGSFSGMSWENIRVMTGVVPLSLFPVFFMTKPIGAYQLGKVYAQNMGVNILRFRVALILMPSILSACVTAFTGPISFVGVAMPHLVKSLFKTVRSIMVIPGCFLGGVVFCLFCDLVARTVFTPTELSISPVTAVFGTPTVIYTVMWGGKGMQ